MLQGDVVREWCTAALRKWSAPCSRRGATVDELDRCCAALQGISATASTLADAAEAAHEEVGGTAAGAPPHLLALLRLALEAERHAQHAEVALWVATHRADLAPYERSAGTHDVWMESVQRRRELAGEAATTFLDDILEALSVLADGAGAPSGWPQYPPQGGASVADFAQHVMLEGGCDANSVQAKHALLLYFLLDLGLEADSPPFEALVARLLLPSAFVLDCRAYFWLDDDREDSLDAAARVLPLAASPNTPAKIPAALLARGRPEAALAVLRAAGDGASLAKAERAAAGIGARLACGLIEEAFLHARQCVDAAGCSQGEGERAMRRAELVAQIARSCLACGAAPRLVQLPFDEAEEASLVAELEAIAGEAPGGAAGDALVTYYLQRARPLEAEAAHRELVRLEETWASDPVVGGDAAERRRGATADRAVLVEAACRGASAADRREAVAGAADEDMPAVAAGSPASEQGQGQGQEQPLLLAVASSGAQRAASATSVPSPFMVQQQTAVVVPETAGPAASPMPGATAGVARAPSVFAGTPSAGGLFGSGAAAGAAAAPFLPPMSSRGHDLMED